MQRMFSLLAKGSSSLHMGRTVIMSLSLILSWAKGMRKSLYQVGVGCIKKSMYATNKLSTTGDDPALTNLLEGRWDPAPKFSPATMTTTGMSMKKNKASTLMMGSNHESLLESMMVGENIARLPESPVTPCPRPTRRTRERYGMRNGMMVVR